MAKNVGQTHHVPLCHSNGLPVECVIADRCIGGVTEAAMAAEKFPQEGVGVSLTVTPCWCYGSETMDMDTCVPKGHLGLQWHGTARRSLSCRRQRRSHQKGLPAFTIYGRDVQNIGDTAIPGDVRGKILSFVKAGVAIATIARQSYLSTRRRFDGHCRFDCEPGFV